ncbi:glycosyltransferase family 4 protein [Arenibacter sp. F26102]|uniref:glycosyltransferase family 4 protein n=1 Tax=Arenibacter sp. F26102 TaxID=2926416 RepID=UPI001FF4F349|nr:glycosyltransferase family 4 protein [Arenibacter sp. F26102]MCK0147056.1 glycosyltransferase family 4 protein [Arenibacter sp. F26102]
MQNPKILIICSLGNSLINFRGDFIATLIQNNFEVWCAAPEFDDIETIDALKVLGAKTITYTLESDGLNPIKDLQSIKDLKAIIKKNKIDIVFPYTIKPVIYSSIAARKFNIPVYSLITGLGFTFSGVTLKAKFLQLITQFLYREALKKNEAVIFQNKDDQNLFIDKKIITEKQKSYVVDGSGINLKRFKFRVHNRDNDDTIKFIIIGRLIKEKGVELFLEAAKTLKQEYPKAEFHLIGNPPDNNSSAVSMDYLDLLHKDKIIHYHGHQDNVIPILSEADVFVLPSYYREGVPRSILEALSIGMPIITTMMPGCRETIIPDKNGILIPPKELDPLTNAMKYFLDNPQQIAIMGKNSRELAESKFDVDLINSKLLKIINPKQ